MHGHAKFTIRAIRARMQFIDQGQFWHPQFSSWCHHGTADALQASDHLTPSLTGKRVFMNSAMALLPCMCSSDAHGLLAVGQGQTAHLIYLSMDLWTFTQQT